MKLQSIMLGAGLLAASCFAVAGEHHHHKPHWSYEGAGAAEHWGDLESGFATCKTGKEQSPIDIVATKKSASLKPIGFAYSASAAEVVNNGHTVQVNLANGGAIKLGNDEFKLLQFHFHTPSEEKINGKAYPLVAHLVHKSADGKLAVVGVLFTLGKENAALKGVFENMPATEGGKKALAATLNAADILPADRSYYAFKGSLTTPPCSEGVRWQVLKNPVEMSVDQFAAFRNLYSLNARPIQPLNGRAVTESK